MNPIPDRLSDILLAHPSLDYQELRAEAIRYIEGIVGKAWSDYNAHDPGITILEAVCYSLLDLGYRTDFEMADLLTSYTGTLRTPRDFYTAAQILPTCPLTIKDYRKLLLDHIDDLSGKRVLNNAWLTPTVATEVALDYEPTPELLVRNPNVKKEPVHFNGLYEVQLDFWPDPDALLGDLNSNKVFAQSSDGTALVIHLPFWDEWDRAAFSQVQGLRPGNSLHIKLNSFTAPSRGHADEYFPEYTFQIDLQDSPSGGNTIQTLEGSMRAQHPHVMTLDYPLSQPTQTLALEIAPLQWQNIFNFYREKTNDPAVTAIQATFIQPDPSTQITEGIVPSPGYESIIFVTIQYTLSPSQTVYEFEVGVRFKALEPIKLPFTQTDITDALIDRMTVSNVHNLLVQHYLRAAAYENVLTAPQNYFGYFDRIAKVFDLIEGTAVATGIKPYLSQHRNLCEDFVKFSAIRTQDIGLAGTVVISPAYDESKVMAQLYFEIAQFLSPIAHFHSLGEMLEKGYRVEEFMMGRF